MEIARSTVVARDGTKLATYRAGLPAGPTLVLANGLGGNIEAWRYLVEHFAPRYRIVSWDYRGLYRSGRCPDGPAGYAMEHHIRDLEDVLEAEKVDRAVFLGWSMGVQLNFEFWRNHPARFLGLVQINGAPGRIFDTAFRADWFRTLMPTFLSIFERSGPIMEGLGPLALSTRALVAVAKAVGLASPTLDEEVFFDLARDYVHLDFHAYTHTFRALGEHDARDVLPTISVPTLIITGEKDLFTPLELSRHMAETIPGAELMTVRGGTHYTPIEYPMVVNLRVEKFFRERLGL